MIIDHAPPPSFAPDCRVTSGSCDGVAVLHLQGELVARSAGVLRDELAAIVGAPRVLLDLPGITWLDSVGLGVLIGTLRHIHEAHGEVSLAGARTPVNALLHSVGIDRLVMVAPSVQAALHELVGAETVVERTERGLEGGGQEHPDGLTQHGVADPTRDLGSRS